MSENPIKESDQANELKKLLSDVTRQESSNDPTLAESETLNTLDETKKIDVLNLPPRKEIHGGKASRMKIKITKPYIRLIVVVSLIIILFASGFYMWGEELINMIKHI